MKIPRVLALLVLPVAVAVAQPAALVLPVAGSQPNSPGATLAASGVVVDAAGLSTSFTAGGPGAPSTTLATSLLLAQIPPAAGPLTSVTFQVSGAPFAPIALLGSFSPSQLSCTVPPFGTPCGSPWLPGAFPTPFGTLHLGLPPIAFLDGIGLGLNPAAPAALDAAGLFALGPVAVPWTLGGPIFAPDNVVAQVLVADPAAPAGYTLTAAFAMARWPIWCLVC